GGGRGRGRGGGGGAASGEGGGSTEALVTLNISWRSSLLLRKAVVRARLGAGGTVPAEAQDLISKDQESYVIVVTGVPAGMDRLSQNAVLWDKTTIRFGKKSPVPAKNLDIQARTQTVDLIYAFPKTQQITADDKEVEVVLMLGQIEAKKKFTLKDMM